MSLERALARMLPGRRLRRRLPVVRMVHDPSKIITDARARIDCATYIECCDAWIAEHFDAPAKCPDGCSVFRARAAR